MCGSFYFYTRQMATTIPFNKSYSNPHDIVSLLQSRGLHISDTNKAEHYIERIGYYRLSAYMHPFLCAPKELNKYKRNASFDKVMMLYRFDKKFAQIEHSRHRSFNNFIANALNAIAAFCFFEKKPAIDVDFVNDGQLSLF